MGRANVYSFVSDFRKSDYYFKPARGNAVKPWSVEWAIKDRVQKEAWEKFWKELEPSKLIELKKIKVKYSAGLVNFAKTLLLDLRP